MLALNAVVGFWEEFKADNEIEALKKNLALHSRVLRDGKWSDVEAKTLVAGILSWSNSAMSHAFHDARDCGVQHGKIRLLIDASGFNGWENIAAFENHAGFVKNHQKKIERIAVITAHEWQHWLIGAVRIFVHPDIRAYDESHASEALQWIVG